MTTLRSISDFLDAVSPKLKSLIGLYDDELFLNCGFWVSLGRSRTVVLTFTNMKSLRSSKSRLEKILCSSEGLDQINIAEWPVVNYWGSERYHNRGSDVSSRLDCLTKIRSAKPLVILTTGLGLRQKTMSVELFDDNSLEIEVDQDLDTNYLISKLLEIGYQRTSKVEEKGYFSVRGGLFDVFASGYRKPIRIELIGDSVVSIRIFSEENQRSIKTLDRISLRPISEFIIESDSKEKIAQKLFDHMIEIKVEKYERQGILESFHEGTHFAGYHQLAPLFRDSSSFLHEHLDLRNHDKIAHFNLTTHRNIDDIFENYLNDLEEDYLSKLERNQLSLSPHMHFSQIDDAFLGELFFSDIKIGLQEASHEGDQSIFSPSAQSFSKTVLEKYKDKSLLLERITELNEPEKIIFCCESGLKLEKIEATLKYRGLAYRRIDHVFDFRKIKEAEAKFILVESILERDYYNKGEKWHFIPTSVFWGKFEDKTTKERRLKNYLKSFKDLKHNDLVVHVNHGVGKYLGMSPMTIGRQSAEFLIVEYAGGDKVYVPVDKVTMLQRYTPSSGSKIAAPLDRLSSSSWERRKNKVRAAVEIMAEELIAIHAKRAIAKAPKYGPATEDFEKFIDDFPYEETPDQLKAVEEIDLDFQSGIPMDRLLIGDVGFGKTEIAMRAAIRSVLEGYQVMVLAPTTVLCYQHFQTFNNRMLKFGVKILPVNRFVRPQEIRDAKLGWADGSVDILIGTHKLLNKQFKPRRLGLLIVDEEQRFGVGHKERIKELKTNAAILTMSATPIPRTLHMSMLGLKNISLLATPPKNRMSVKNFLISFDDQLLKNAVEHEVRRGGQVFVVHNRVEDIAEVGSYFASLCANVKVRVAHGQMSESELENVIKDFLDNKFSVLICTTIIESGIDMPNVNTILINNAHRFGLSQLYQLRGRVGRSGVQAYSYFIAPAVERLSEESRKRMQVIMAHQDLGAGFQIASNDMELRGAGSVLGEKQSGHVATVGIELYTKMLENAISRVKGLEVDETIDPEIRLLRSTIIPAAYVENQSRRLAFYKQLFSLQNEDEIDAFKLDIIDQYGEPPTEFNNLVEVAMIKIKLVKLRTESLFQRGDHTFEIKFLALDENRIGKLLDVAEQKPENYQLMPDYKLVLSTNSKHQQTVYKDVSYLLDPLIT